MSAKEEWVLSSNRILCLVPSRKWFVLDYFYFLSKKFIKMFDFDFSEKREMILLAQKDKINTFSLKELNKAQTLPITGLQNVIAVEYDVANDCVFYADIVTDVIAVSWAENLETTVFHFTLRTCSN